jgi:hypothetical protein
MAACRTSSDIPADYQISEGRAMPTDSLRAQAIADTEWVLAWLKNDEPLSVAAVSLAAIAMRLTGKKRG